jgi:[acyl-carrier-protein] S-malonyltransferase
MKLAGERNPGGMAAVLGLEVAVLETACAEAREATGGVAQIANDNCPGQTVISGDQATLELAMEKAQAAEAKKVVRLAVSIASHSPLMQVISDEFGAVVEAAPIVDAAIPLVANVSAGPIQSAADIRAELKAQLTSPVRWTESMRWLIDHGVDRVIEVGPQDVLTKLMRRIDRSVTRFNVGDVAEISL